MPKRCPWFLDWCSMPECDELNCYGYRRPAKEPEVEEPIDHHRWEDDGGIHV